MLLEAAKAPGIIKELFNEKRPYLWPFFPALPFKNASLRSSLAVTRPDRCFVRTPGHRLITRPLVSLCRRTIT